MYNRMRKLIAMRMDERVWKKGMKYAKKYNISFGRMTELLWRWYFNPDEAKDFAERLKEVEDFGEKFRR